MANRAPSLQELSSPTSPGAVEELTQLVDQYAGTLSQALSELTLLFQLVEDLDVSKDAEKFAEEILPSLPSLLGAEAVYFIESRHDEADGLSIANQKPLVCAGNRRLDDDSCRHLVEQFRKEAETRPAVRNNLHQISSPEIPDLVKHIILTTVAKGDFSLGLLLAVNRIAPDHLNAGFDNREAPDRQQVGWALSDCEFGTEQAALLDSAAKILATHGRNVALFREKEALFVGTIRALVSAIEAKDPYTCGHSERVATISKQLGEELNLDEKQLERLYLTALLHDIGKIGVRESVLQKPGKLTDEEFEEIKQHVVIGHTILQNLTPISYVLPGVRHHHEAYDGSGYPDGLVGEGIPFIARVIAVADSYDAMTSSRPYRNAMPTERVEQILRQGAGSQWDAKVIEAFFRTHNQ